MNAFLIYALEVNISLLLFAFVYYLFFRNESYHVLNRTVILGMIAASFLMPFLDFTRSDVPIHVIELETLVISAKQETLSSPVGWNIPSFLSIAYIVGCMVALVILVKQFAALRKLIANGQKTIKEGVETIMQTELKSPSSFFKSILWNADVKEQDEKWIMEHEMVHIRENHSLDILVLRLAQVICWFNPAIYFFSSAIEATHEFRADELVAKKYNDKTHYSNVLLSQALGVDTSVLVHQFSKPNLLKRRIMMLNKQQTNKKSILKYGLLLPALALALAFNACSKEDQASNSQVETEPVAMQTDQDVFDVVDQMPEYPGGMESMMQFLGDNIKYPENCKTDGIEGTVFLSFIIDKEGMVTDVQAMKSPDPRLSAAAMDVVGRMPKWTPGKHKGKVVKVKMVLPVKYTFDEEDAHTGKK